MYGICGAENGNIVIGSERLRDKRAKFVELANQRVSKAIDQIRLVGNLSNRAAYEFTDDDVKKIVKALQKAVESARARFTDSGSGNDQSFRIE